MLIQPPVFSSIDSQSQFLKTSLNIKKLCCLRYYYPLCAVQSIPYPIFQKIHNLSPCLICEELPVAKQIPATNQSNIWKLPLIYPEAWRPTWTLWLLFVAKRNPSDNDDILISSNYYLNISVVASSCLQREKCDGQFQKNILQKMKMHDASNKSQPSPWTSPTFVQ